MILASAALAAALAAGPGSVGVGIGANPVCLDVTLSPCTYSLGTVTVSNSTSGPGASSEAITVAAAKPIGQAGNAIPASWIHADYGTTLWIFHRRSVTVAPGMTADVPLSITIPPRTEPGRWVADLYAETGPGAAPASSGGGVARFSAAAETPLVVTVSAAAGQPASCAVHPAPVPSISGPPTAQPTPAATAPAASSSPAPAATAPAAAADPSSPTGRQSSTIGWIVLTALAVLAAAGLRKVFG
jgi:hypothetical protein